MGGYERNPAAWALDGVPDGFEAQLLPEDWERFDELLHELGRARAGDGDGRGQEALQRPRGVHARRRVHPRRVGRARVLGRGRVLRSRPGRRRRHGLADGRVDRERRAEPRPVAHGLAPVRPPVPEPGLHARPGDRDLRDLLRHQVPQPRARGGPAAATLAGLRPRWRRWAPSSARSRGGSGRTGSSRTPRWATRTCGRGAGRASTGRRRSTPSRSRPASGRASSTRARSPRSRCRGRALLAFLQRLCANDVDTPVGIVTYTQMLNARGGIECDFTVTRLGARALPDRHRHRLRKPRPRLDQRSHNPRRIGRGCRRHVGLRVPRDLGAARARHPAAAAPTSDLSNEALPLHARARDLDRPRARAWPSA